MQITINLRELIALINKVYVWLPEDSHIRPEVKAFLDQLRTERDKNI